MLDIPKGFATKLGTIGAAILAVVAAVTPFLDGDHTGDTRFFAALATVLAGLTVLGRMLQAAAALRDTPSPFQTGDFTDPAEWSDAHQEPVSASSAPSEATLKATYPEEPPTVGGKAGEPR